MHLTDLTTPRHLRQLLLQLPRRQVVHGFDFGEQGAQDSQRFLARAQAGVTYAQLGRARHPHHLRRRAPALRPDPD